MTEEQLRNIITMGEGYQAEFKKAVPSKAREIAEEVCAFANAAGGQVLIGVDDNNNIVRVSGITNSGLLFRMPLTALLQD